MTTRVYIDLVGRIMLAELIALFALPFININKLIREYKGLRMVLLGLLALLVSQMLSDFVNNSASDDFLRGWSLIVFSMISTVYLVNYLSRTPNGIIYYLCGLFIIHSVFGEGDLNLSLWEENTNYFKIRFIGFLNPAVLIASYYLYKSRCQRLTMLLFMLFSMVCFGFEARSNGLIFLITTALLFYKSVHNKTSLTKLYVYGGLSSILFYPLYVYYVDLVLSHGLSGSNSLMQLSRASNPYNPLELLYYGRLDFFVLIQAILDNPIWGYGSWGKDPNGYYANLLVLLSDTSSSGGVGYIRAHSVFLGTWVYAGILGFIASTMIFFKLYQMFFNIYKSNIHTFFLPILTFLTIASIWDFMFSPLGVLRVSFPIFAALIIVEKKNIQVQEGE